MARLTRAQRQERTRAAVLAAARAEFGEHGYADAKIDRIAERAELTRGAVYSNFPSKRALYLAVLLELVEARWADEPRPTRVPESAADALEAFARAWLERLPLTGGQAGDGRLASRSLTGVLEDNAVRAALAQVARLEALLLALTLESYEAKGAGAPKRRVRLAELVLTMLQGAAHLAEIAPGFGDPFDVASACARLAEADLPDAWNPPHLTHVRPALPCRDPWTPIPAVRDLVGGGEVALGEDGVVVFLGVDRLGAVEEAVRAVAGEAVTVVVLTDDPDEIGRLVRLRIRDLVGRLRRVVSPDRLPWLRVVLDDGRIGRAFRGLEPAVDAEGARGSARDSSASGSSASEALGDRLDAQEAAVRIRAGEIIARAWGRGAGYAAASVTIRDTAPSEGTASTG